MGRALLYWSELFKDLLYFVILTICIKVALLNDVLMREQSVPGVFHRKYDLVLCSVSRSSASFSLNQQSDFGVWMFLLGWIFFRLPSGQNFPDLLGPIAVESIFPLSDSQQNMYNVQCSSAQYPQKWTTDPRRKSCMSRKMLKGSLSLWIGQQEGYT